MERLLRPSVLDLNPDSTSAPSHWNHWIHRFQNFIRSTDANEEEKLCLLINYISPEVFEYVSNADSYNNAIAILKSIFIKPVNEVFARHKLLSRRQQPNESVDHYLEALRLLSRDCQFKAVTAETNRDDCIRDSFIRGLANPNIRQRLLENSPTFSLGDAHAQARSLELAQAQSKLYDDPFPTTGVNAVHGSDSASGDPEHSVPNVCAARKSVLGLRNVSLVILPPAVERGLEAQLLCQYDLEGAPLYAVKWYRGVREFYRYSPNDNPPTKIFPYQGIHVDVSASNASQVVLSKVGFNLSGNLSCEVTTDAPSFSTALVSKELMVIELPKGEISLHADKERYDVGDVLRGNCTSAPSKPAAVLSAFMNSIPVNKPETRVFPYGDGLQYTVLYLELRVEPAHMSNNGALILRCSAVVAAHYKQTAELSLGPRTSEPVPERVTSPSQSTRMLPCHLVVIILTPFLWR